MFPRLSRLEAEPFGWPDSPWSPFAFAAPAVARVDTYALDPSCQSPHGLGFGPVALAEMGLGMTGVQPEESGVASGLFNTTQQIGGAVGLALLSAIASARAFILKDGA